MQRPALTSRGAAACAGAAALAVGGTLSGAEELVLFSIGLGVLVVGGAVQASVRAWRASSVWRIAVRLSGADAPVGSHVEVGITLTAGDVRSPVHLEDPDACWYEGAVPPTEAASPRGTMRAAGRAWYVPPGVTTTMRFAAPTDQRGIYILRGPRLWSLDTFGLLAAIVGQAPSATVTVYPVPLRVTVPPALLDGRPAIDELEAASPYTHLRRDTTGDLWGVRPYVPGDRLRLLYWPALARTGELFVRDFEAADPRRVSLVVDTRRSLLGPLDTERVLAAAAGLSLQALRGGRAVDLWTLAGQRITARPDASGPMTVLRGLAGVATDADTEHDGRRRGRGSSDGPPGFTDSGPRASGVLFDRPGWAPTPLVITSALGARSLPPTLGRATVVTVP